MARCNDDDFEYVILDDDSVMITKYKGNTRNLDISESIAGRIVTTIGRGAFRWKEKVLTHVTVPPTIRMIDEFAFAGCVNLQSIVFMNPYTELRPFAFSGCSSLAKTDLPSRIQTIPRALFIDCSSIRKLDLPTTITTIENGAFQNCTALESAVMPREVAIVEAAVFAGCKSLSRVVLSPDT